MIFSSDVIFLLYCINDASFSTNLYILKSTDENASDLLFRKNKIEYVGVVPPHKLAKHRIWCSLNVNLQWPSGGNLGPTCIGFFCLISFSNNRGCPQIFHYRTLQNSLVITYALLFDSNFPLLRSIPTIYLKSVTSHQLLKRMVQCRTLPFYELLGDEFKISESRSCRFLRKGERERLIAVES